MTTLMNVQVPSKLKIGNFLHFYVKFVSLGIAGIFPLNWKISYFRVEQSILLPEMSTCPFKV